MKRSGRIISVVLLLALLATCLVAFSLTGTAESEPDYWDGATYTEPTQLDADGTTILVTTAAEFAWIAKNPASASGSYRLTTDVDMGGKSATPESGSLTFSGILDGDGHAVQNIVNGGGGGFKACCLFANVSGTVKNLTIKDSNFSARGSGVAPFVGGGLTGTLENCHVKNTVIYGYSASGLVNSCGGTIRNCTVDETTTITASPIVNLGTHTLGGICASVTSTSAVIENCTVNGTMTGTNTYGNSLSGGTKNIPVIAGGLIGSIEIGYGGWSWAGLKNCVNNATITMNDKDGTTPESAVAGGLIGQITRYGGNAGEATLKFAGCVNNGDITVTSSFALGVGGFIGRARDSVVIATDCVNSGDITAPAITNVGGFIGTSHLYSASGAKYTANSFKNCGQYGALTGAANVGGAIGYTYRSTTLENVVLAGSVNLSESAAADALTATIIAFQTANIEGTKTVNKVTVPITLDDCTLAMTNVYSPLTAALYNPDPAVTGTLNVTRTSVVTGDAFTGRDLNAFSTALNTAASANGWREWTVVGAPKYLAFYEPPVVITNTSALTHPYTGQASVVTYTQTADVTRVEVLWYLASDLDNALAEAPSAVGSYKVVLKAYAGKTQIAADREFSATFEITKAETQVVPDLSGLTYDSDTNTYTTAYTGTALALTAAVKNKTTGQTPTGAEVTQTVTKDEVAATLVNPGTYSVTFLYAGDANHQSSSTTVTVVITKRQVEYPANIWNFGDPAEGIIEKKYTGAAQTAELIYNQELFTVVYTDNTGTGVSDTVYTSKATVTLKTELEDYYELIGEAPDPDYYSIQWKIIKGDVTLKFVDTDGEGWHEVTLGDAVYDGTSKTYYVIAVNEAGRKVGNATPATLTVCDAKTYNETYSYPVTDDYNPQSISLSFTVAPASVVATLDRTTLDKTYNGTAVTFAPTFEDAPTAWADYTLLIEKKNGSDWETVTEAKNGGEYRVTVTRLTTDGNYRATVTTEFAITRADATIEPPSTGWTLNGSRYETTYNNDQQPFNPIVSEGAVYAVTYDYHSDNGTVSGLTEAPTHAGTYTVHVTVTETDNYNAGSATYSIVILPQVVTIPTDAELWDYTGPFTFDGNAHTVQLRSDFLALYDGIVAVTYNGSGATYAGTYTMTVTLRLEDDGKNTAFAGTTETSVTKSIDWIISPMTLAMEDLITFEDTLVTYDGQAHGIEAIIPEGIAQYLDVTYTGRGTNVGSYDVTVTFAAKTEYATSVLLSTSSFTKTLTVKKANAQITTNEEELEVVFDGNDYIDAITASVMNGRKDLTGFVTIDKTVTKDDLPVDEIVDVGTYTIVFTMRSSSNVNVSDSKTVTIIITKATYTAGSITVSGDTTYVAPVKEGDEVPTITLNVTKVGSDGSRPRIDESRLPEIPTKPGTYTLTWYFINPSKNYEDLPPFEVTVTVLKPGIVDTDRNVYISAENGLDADMKFVVSDAEFAEKIAELITGAALPESISTPAVKALYTYAIQTADGEAVDLTALGEVRVEILLPERFVGSENLTELLQDLYVFKVSYGKNGEPSKVTALSAKKDGLEYNPETGVISFKLQSTDLAYGYVVNESKVGTFVLAGLEAAVVVAAVTVMTVKLVKRKKHGTPDDEN